MIQRLTRPLRGAGARVLALANLTRCGAPVQYRSRVAVYSGWCTRLVAHSGQCIDQTQLSPRGGQR